MGGTHSYTYVPAKDPNSVYVRRLARKIDGMSMQDAKQHLLRLKVETDNTYLRFRQLLKRREDTYDEMLQKGWYWLDAKQSSGGGDLFSNIQQLSSMNLCYLARELEQLPPKYKVLMDRLEYLPFTIKHNTKPDHKGLIERTHTILSLTEIHRRGLGNTLKGGTDHEGRDHKMIHNEDFVFFRMALGTSPAHSRFGSVCFVFRPDKLFQCGWISLHDMLSPASTSRMAVFPTIEKISDLQPKQSSVPAIRPRGDFGLRITVPSECGITYRYPAKGQLTRRIHKVNEVFYGPDIRKGIAYSVVLELFNMLGTEGLDMALELCPPGKANDELLLVLISNLFFLEAKFPREFRFTPFDLLQVHENVPYTKSSKYD